MAEEQEKQSYERRNDNLIDLDFQLGEVNRGVGLFMTLILMQGGLFGVIAYLNRREAISGISASVMFTIVAFVVPLLLCVLYCRSTIRRTHRVAGAAYRIREDIYNMISNPSFRFHLRDDDYLWDIARELNQTMEVLEDRQISLDKMSAEIEKIRKEFKNEAGKLTKEQAQSLHSRLENIERSLLMVKGTSERKKAEKTEAPKE